VNVDEILQTLNSEQLQYLLIGGMNFLLRHVPELTFDVDIWVEDSEENLPRLNRAMRKLGAEWGRTEKEWRPISEDWHWLQTQNIFCVTTKQGAVDIFREVRGLENRYEECRRRAISSRTATGIPFMGLSDEDMLLCQEALPVEEQKVRRIEILREAIRKLRKQE
jgi:hypothetical protein